MKTWPRIREAIISAFHALVDYDRKIPDWKRQETASTRAEARRRRLMKDAIREEAAARKRRERELADIAAARRDAPEHSYQGEGRQWTAPHWYADYDLVDRMRNGVRARHVGCSGKLTTEKIERILAAMHKEDPDIESGATIFDVFYAKLQARYPECCDGRPPVRKLKQKRAQAAGGCLILLLIVPIGVIGGAVWLVS